MAGIDWHYVYLQERHRPGYVLENGRSPIKRSKEAAPKPEPNPTLQEKRKAA
jgi:hypothetical protein